MVDGEDVVVVYYWIYMRLIKVFIYCCEVVNYGVIVSFGRIYFCKFFYLVFMKEDFGRRIVGVYNCNIYYWYIGLFRGVIVFGFYCYIMGRFFFVVEFWMKL